MAPKFENVFVVDAPVATVWTTLLDLERVARCLPGATIEPADEEGTFHGSMRVKLGPVSVAYKGTAKLTSADEQAHIAVFQVKGKETTGQGSASATIANRLEDNGSSTRVSVETDLSVTGRPAQFGRGIMQDVATAMLTDFSRCLSTMMAASAEPESGGRDLSYPPAPGGAPSTTSLPAPAPVDSLGLGRLIRVALLRRIRALFARRRPEA